MRYLVATEFQRLTAFHIKNCQQYYLKGSAVSLVGKQYIYNHYLMAWQRDLRQQLWQ